jgi:hypothetical protein
MQANVDEWRLGEDKVDLTIAVSMMTRDIVGAAMEAEEVLKEPTSVDCLYLYFFCCIVQVAADNYAITMSSVISNVVRYVVLSDL